MDGEPVGPWEEAWAEFDERGKRDILYWLHRFHELSRADQQRALDILDRLQEEGE